MGKSVVTVLSGAPALPELFACNKLDAARAAGNANSASVLNS
jgi:hypothetical protein